jgi:hypothetical protein
LSLGAWVEESLSTRLDSVRAPDRLCVDEDRLEPDVRFREFSPERFFDEDERPFDFEELRELPEPLLLDRDFCWGILPGSSQYQSFSPSIPSVLQYVLAGYPNPAFQTRGAAVWFQERGGRFKSPAQRVMQTNRRRETRSWHGSQERREQWRRQRVPRVEVRRGATRGRGDRRAGIRQPGLPVRVPSGPVRTGADQVGGARPRPVLGGPLRHRRARQRTAHWPRPEEELSRWHRRPRAHCSRAERRLPA